MSRPAEGRGRRAGASVSSPGVHFGDPAAARAPARGVDEDGAAVVRARPGSFGLFASLPLPDVDAALAEPAYALDVLGADGVVLETNTHGVCLGGRAAGVPVPGGDHLWVGLTDGEAEECPTVTAEFAARFCA